MIKAIIIDDEPLAIEIIASYLKSYPEINLVATCQNGFEGARAIQEMHPELVFLDIQMPKISGFEMLELIDEPPGIIFTTAFDQFAVKAFEANAVDYLLKPVDKERFHKAIQKFLARTSGETRESLLSLLQNGAESISSLPRIVVKSGNEIKILAASEVDYLEAYDDYVKIYKGAERFVKKKTLAFFEQHLPEGMFIRVHRSFLVRVSAIDRIEQAGKDSHQCILKNNSAIPISRSGYSKLKSALGI